MTKHPRYCCLLIATASILVGCEDRSSESASQSPGIEESQSTGGAFSPDYDSDAFVSGSLDTVPSTFVSWDSSGVIIAETEGAEARRALPWVISAAPILEIGRAEGDEAYLLSRVRGSGRLHDGRIFVVDGSSRQLRFYDSRGTFLRSIGRAGEGPGEFSVEPMLVPLPEYDSVTVFDGLWQRFSIVASDGESIRSLPSLRSSQLPGVAEGAISISAGFVGKRVLARYSKPSALSLSGGPQPLPDLEYRLTDPETGVSELIRKFSLQAEIFMADLGPSGARVPIIVPFYVVPLAVAGGDRFYLGTGRTSEILEFDSRGALRRSIRLDEPDRPITEADLTKFIEGQIFTSGRQGSAAPDESARRAAYREAPLPESMPVFRALLVDEMGWLWAETYRPDPSEAPEWLLFDEEGRGHGSLQLPDGFQLHQAGEDFVLGVWKDELGVERVRMYGLRRG